MDSNVIQTQALETEITTALGTLITRVEPHQGKNAVILVGPTGAGKSTIAALLAGSQLTAQNSPSGECVLKETNPQNTQITIGHGGRTGTTLPGSAYVQARQLVLWDCPGFDDVRGAVSDIVNAASIHKLLESSSKVKIVVVLSEEMIKALRGAASFPLFNQLAEMFPDTTQLYKMVSLVITKKRSNFNPLVRLEEYVEANDNTLSSGGRGLLSYLCQNQSNRISYLPEATQEGPYTTAPTDIWAKIGNAQYVQHPTAKVAVPVGAREYLRSLSAELNKNIVNSLLNSSASIVHAFKQSNTALANNPDQLKQHLTNRINEIKALGQILPNADITNIRAFTLIKGLPQETKAALVSFIDQIHILKGISGGMDGIKFDILEWFKPLKDISIDWMDSIKNAEITRLDKEAALALTAQKEQLVAQKEQALLLNAQALNQMQNNLNASQALAAQRERELNQNTQALNQERINVAVKTTQYDNKVAEIQILRETKDALIQALNQKISQLQTANQTLTAEKGTLSQTVSQLQTANQTLEDKLKEMAERERVRARLAILPDLETSYRKHLEYLAWHEMASKTSPTYIAPEDGKTYWHSEMIKGNKEYIAKNREEYYKIMDEAKKLGLL